MEIPINQEYNIVGLKLEPVSLSIFMLKSFINHHHKHTFKLLFISNNNDIIDLVHDLLVKLSVGLEHFEVVSMSAKSKDKGRLSYGAMSTANIMMVNVVKFVKFINSTNSNQQHDILMKIIGVKTFDIILVCDAFVITEQKKLVEKLFEIWNPAGFNDDGYLICISQRKDDEENARMKAVIKQFWINKFK